MASRDERLALAQAGMDAFNDGDVARMLAALSDDVEVYASPELANAGQYSGHGGFASWITAWTDAWEEVSAEVTDNTPVGETARRHDHSPGGPGPGRNRGEHEARLPVRRERRGPVHISGDASHTRGGHCDGRAEGSTRVGGPF